MDGQLGQGFVQRLLHAIGQQHALGRGFVEQGFGLAFALALQSNHGGLVGTQGRQFLDQCSRGLALGIQRHGDRHQLLRDCLVFGLGEALVTSSSAAMVADMCKERHYGTAMGVFGTIFDIGHASGPILGGLLIGSLGYRVASFSWLWCLSWSSHGSSGVWMKNSRAMRHKR